jgi:signal transduction histidine kinase
MTLTPPYPRASTQENQSDRISPFDPTAVQEKLEFGNLIVSRLAHDYGNIFTTLSGFLDLSLSQLPRSESRLTGYLQEVRRACQDGVEMTSRLRELSKRQALTKAPCDLVDVLTSEVNRRSRGSSPRIRFTLDAPEYLPRVNTNEEVVASILTELLNNGVQAVGQEGSIAISVSRRRLQPGEQGEYLGKVSPGEHVEVVVADSGCGMSADTQGRLFRDPFFTTKPKRGGYGLFLVYGQLCAYRGGLRIDSRENAGTSVRVVIPSASHGTSSLGSNSSVTPVAVGTGLGEAGSKQSFQEGSGSA